MLSVNPSNRPDAADILTKDWVKASTMTVADKKVAQPKGNFFAMKDYSGEKKVGEKI